MHGAFTFPTPEGLSLAGVLIARRPSDGNSAVANSEEEMHTLLCAAYGKSVSSASMRYIRRGNQLLEQVPDDELSAATYPYFPKPTARVTSGDNFSALTKALMLFALSGLGKVEDIAASRQRLLKARALLKRGADPRALLAKMRKAGFNPDEPRDERGRWTASDSHLLDIGSISSDDVRRGAHGTKPSSLPQGVQVAANDTMQNDAPSHWGNPDTLQRHFDDHSADFNATSPTDYANQANQFFKRAQEEKLPMIEYPNGGEIAAYDPASNTFGVYTPDGRTQSFYKPSSPTYFQRQIDYVSHNSGKIINPMNSSSGGMGGIIINPEDIYHSDPFIDEEEKKPLD